MSKERLTLWVTPEAKAAVKQRAEEAGVSMSAWVSVMASNGLDAIAEYIDRRSVQKLSEAFGRQWAEYEKEMIAKYGAEKWAQLNEKWDREYEEKVKRESACGTCG